jgi:FkbM family methyltransferase
VSGSLGRQSALVTFLRPAYDRYLAWSAGPSGLLHTVNDEAFRIDPRVRHHMPELYEPQAWRYLKAHARPGQCALNIGAHMGIYALALARWTSPAGRVCAFEPNPATRAVLATHVALNNAGDSVEILADALSDRPDDAMFFVTGEEGYSRLNAQNPLVSTSTRLAVRTTSIDAFCAARGVVPDWIVMDVEGHELAVLDGARETIRCGRGRLRLLVEMHPGIWPVAGGSRERMAALLDSLELRAVALDGDEDPLGTQRVVRLVYI